MPERLFTYGSLMPGGQYAHLLAGTGNDWQAATVTGFIDTNGWGHSVGYPALLLHKDGNPIPGKVLSSSALPAYWERLDKFEGAAYQRIATSVTLGDGRLVTAFIYTLHPDLQAPIKSQLGLTQ